MYKVKKIKEEVDIEMILDALGIEYKDIGNKISILCPFHNDKNLGSCFWKKGCLNGYCYSCGASFDIFHLVSEVTGLNFLDTCAFIVNLTDNPCEYTEDSTERELKPYINNEEIKCIFKGEESLGYDHVLGFSNPEYINGRLIKENRMVFKRSKAAFLEELMDIDPKFTSKFIKDNIRYNVKEENEKAVYFKNNYSSLFKDRDEYTEKIKVINKRIKKLNRIENKLEGN